MFFCRLAILFVFITSKLDDTGLQVLGFCWNWGQADSRLKSLLSLKRPPNIIGWSVINTNNTVSK